MHFLSELKTIANIWRKTFLFHLLFSGCILASFFFTGQAILNKSPEQAIGPLLGVFGSFWLWLLFSGYSLSFDYTPLRFVKRLPGLLMRGLIWPITLLFLWGNSYTTGWMTSIQLGQPDFGIGFGFSLIITLCFLITLFTLGHSMLAPWKPILPKEERGSAAVKKALLNDLKTLFKLIRSSWKASLSTLFVIVSFFIPLSLISSFVSVFANVTTTTPGLVILTGISWILFSSLGLFMIGGGFMVKKKMIELGAFPTSTHEETDLTSEENI